MSTRRLPSVATGGGGRQAGPPRGPRQPARVQVRVVGLPRRHCRRASSPRAPGVLLNSSSHSWTRVGVAGRARRLGGQLARLVGRRRLIDELLRDTRVRAPCVRPAVPSCTPLHSPHHAPLAPLRYAPHRCPVRSCPDRDDALEVANGGECAVAPAGHASLTSRSVAGPTCVVGFAVADRDGDGMLCMCEALAAAENIRRRLLLVRCIVESNVARTCFGRFAGIDQMIDAHEHAHTFVPCLMSGLSDRCRAVICVGE